ncbi:MAG TPA: autotransporter-associated beta strand repeat-containing protein, partial [Thermomicrobiales bacterium]|nr:autotransporter-associated beta strand repeat-containing protein [Thermomicrobiales bacterium]
GGGGGGGTTGGFAGFGGGGGGNSSIPNGSLFGGSGAAAAGSGAGGGGGAAGGALFVQSGGSLQVIGSFTINGSSLTPGAAGGAGASDGTTGGGGIFLDGVGTLAMNPASGSTVVINDSIADVLGVTGTIDQPAWSLVKGGAGTLVLGGDNKYAGGTVLSQGILSVSQDANLGVGSLFFSGGATLAVTGTSTFTRTVFTDGVDTIRVSPGQTATWSGQFQELSTPSSLNVTGGGTLALANLTNSFTQGVSISGGSTVAVTNDASLGASSGGLALGDASSSGTLSINAPTFTTARAVTLGAGGGVIDTVGGTNATFTGTLSGSGGLTKAGSGTLTLAGAIGYTGPTVIAGGSLRAGIPNLFGPGATLSLGGGGSSIDFGGFSQSLEALTGTGTLAMGGGTLTIGSGGSSSEFDGVITGSGAVVKNGGGTFVMTGANTYGGGTFVNGGALQGNTASIPGNIVDNAAVVFDQGSSGTYFGTISGSGAFGKTGGGTLTFAGPQFYTGGTVIAGGTLVGNTSNLYGTIV